jgi:hypothetical protein
VLARLEQQDGVEAVEVDRRGELLRVEVERTDGVAAIISRLYELGFAAERAADNAAGGRNWYGRAAVGELSREEAGVIAQRVVPAFARTDEVSSDDVGILVELVTAALHQCFVANVVDASTPLGALHGESARAVEAATVSQLGSERARELGGAIEADLAAGRSAAPQ